ncbi:MAG: large repetitive protein, partial [Pseudonocardiales bacterium]|nr:large repetitive protein [Pseudonocardiales bacterium]
MHRLATAPKFATFALATLCVLFFAGEAQASHFRYATVSARTVLDLSNNGQPTKTVSFTLQAAYRRTFWIQNFSQTLVNGNTFVADDFNFGDGTAQFTPTLTVVAYDPNADWVYGSVTFTHTYANAGTYIAFYGNRAGIDSNPNYGCCRIDNLSGLSNQRYRIEVIATPGSRNSAPVSTLLPTINLPVGISNASFLLPAAHFDNDTVRYRLATIAESGLGSVNNDVTPATSPIVVPGNPTINATTGQVVWNTVGLSVGTPYAAQFVVESLNTNGTVKAKTVVDVMMFPVADSGSAPLCLINGSSSPLSITVVPGTPITFTFTGTDPDSGSPALPVTLNASGLPPGAIMSPTLPFTGASPAASTFTWMPTNANVGTFSISFSAIDNTFLQTLNSVSITVSIQPPVITSPASGFTTASQSVPVAGTASPGASVRIDDGATFVGTTTANGSGNFNLNVTLGYGTHTLTARQAQNSQTSQLSNAVAVIVTPPAPAITSPTNGAFVAPNSNVSGTSASSIQTITLYDGVNQIGTTTTSSGGAFSLPVTLSPGPHTLTATLTVNGATSLSSNSVAVTADSPPTASAGGPYAVNEGGTITVSATGSDPDAGDSLSFAWDLDNNGTFETAGQTATFSAAAINGPATRIVSARATDASGLFATASATVTINNVAPTVNAGSDGTTTQGSAFSGSGSFTDPGTDTWTATVDYGDGTGAQPLTLNANKTFSLAHTYTAPGFYTVTVTVNDGTASATDTA